MSPRDQMGMRGATAPEWGNGAPLCRPVNEPAEPVDCEGAVLSRASSISEGGLTSLSGGLMDTGGTDLLDSSCTLVDTGLLDSNATRSLSAAERWQRSYRLVHAGLAFSKCFKTLRDMSKENTIDARRLSKVREIGKGAFALVELCLLESEVSGAPPTPVAVKRLRFEAVKRRSDLKRFFKEAAMLRKLKHRYIATYIGVGNFNYQRFQKLALDARAQDARDVLKSTFIVQEYIPGDSLRDLLLHQMLAKDEVAYTNQEACRWMQQVADGLLYLHTASPKVMHRDLKLENIMLRDLGRGQREACLVDFGISVFLPRVRAASSLTSSIAVGPSQAPHTVREGSGGSGSASGSDQQRRAVDSRDTRAGMLNHGAASETEKAEAFELTCRAGSYMYMAPEVFCHQAYNEKADVFSFGCLLFEVFGRVILSTQVSGCDHKQAAKRYAEKVSTGYRRPFPKSLPVPLQHLISDCWAQYPDRRPGMAEILARLKGLEASDVLFHTDARDKETCACCSVM